MNNIRTNSPSFGMALFAPTQKKVAKVLGKEAAAEFEKARPALEKIANDVDIFVKPDKAWFESENPACNGFMLHSGRFKSRLDARISLVKNLLFNESNANYAWVSLKKMSSVSEQLIEKAQKVAADVK